MPILPQRQVLIQDGPVLRRLAKVEVRDDGSLYVVLSREGRRSGEGLTRGAGDNRLMINTASAGKPKSNKISFHTTGRVNSDYPKATLFFEPLTRLTTRNDFVGYRVPSLERLDEVSSRGPWDVVWPLSHDGPMLFSFYVSPLRPDVDAQDVGAPGILIDTYFRFGIALGPPPIDEDGQLREHFVTYVPNVGKYAEQQANEDQAFVEVYGNSGIVLIPPTLPAHRGIYRVVPAVPMARTPTLRVQFENPKLRAVQSTDARVGNVDITFVVYGPGGRLSVAVRIMSIEFDAEID